LRPYGAADALPDTAPLPGFANPYKARRFGLGQYGRDSRAILSDKTIYSISSSAPGSGTAPASGASYADSTNRTYAGDWTADTNPDVYSDNHPGKFASAAGASYSQKGSGTIVDIYSPVGKNLGEFDVYADTVLKGRYSARQAGASQKSRKLVSIPLAGGNHEITVVAVASGSSNVVLSDKVVFS
jgi:hypothetical protein